MSSGEVRKFGEKEQKVSVAMDQKLKKGAFGVMGQILDFATSQTVRDRDVARGIMILSSPLARSSETEAASCYYADPSIQHGQMERRTKRRI